MMRERVSGLAIVCSLAFFMAVAGTAPAQADPILNARAPSPSPDGSEIAFSYMGDLWKVPVTGGNAERLTVHEAYDDRPVWSPDGVSIAFVSDREGNNDVYVMPATGGAPERLTCHDSSDYLQCWRRDGSAVLFTSSRDTLESELYAASLEGGLPVHVLRDRGFNVAVSPDGRWIAYVRGRTPWWRKHYRGSASRDIWVRAYEGGPSYLIVDSPSDDDRPMWGNDGRTLYFMSERADSVMNIWRVALQLPGPGEPGGPAVARPPTQITAHPHDGVQFAAISEDGNLIVYEWDARLWTLRPPDGQPERLDVVAPSDLKWNDELRMTLTSRATEFALSPDETEIALVVRGEVYVCPFEDGECGTAMRITETPAREKDVAWMPDGRTLLFASDRSGDYDIYSVRSIDDDRPELSKALRLEETRLTDSE